MMGLKVEHYVGHTLEIIYMDRLQRISQRLITIRRVQPEGILAYCHKQKGPRFFRTEQILAALPAARRELG